MVNLNASKVVSRHYIFCLGLLISLMACGIPITYLTLSGSLDSLIPYFGQGTF